MTARLEQGVQPALRSQLIEMRRQLRMSARDVEIKDALDGQRWVDARRLLEKILASADAPTSSRKQAERTLGDLNRRKLGLANETRP